LGINFNSRLGYEVAEGEELIRGENKRATERIRREEIKEMKWGEIVSIRDGVCLKMKSIRILSLKIVHY